jgi:hypothetical protein
MPDHQGDDQFLLVHNNVGRVPLFLVGRIPEQPAEQQACAQLDLVGARRNQKAIVRAVGLQGRDTVVGDYQGLFPVAGHRIITAGDVLEQLGVDLPRLPGSSESRYCRRD